MARVAKRDPRAMIREVFTTEFAHMSLDEAVADFPVASINAKAPNVPYTFWHILEHIRIAQTDLLEYVPNASHVSPASPDGYWPAAAAPPGAAGWERPVRSLAEGQRAIERPPPP